MISGVQRRGTVNDMAVTEGEVQALPDMVFWKGFSKGLRPEDRSQPRKGGGTKQLQAEGKASTGISVHLRNREASVAGTQTTENKRSVGNEVREEDGN